MSSYNLMHIKGENNPNTIARRQPNRVSRTSLALEIKKQCVIDVQKSDSLQIEWLFSTFVLFRSCHRLLPCKNTESDGEGATRKSRMF